jgi:hypothetical protein
MYNCPPVITQGRGRCPPPSPHPGRWWRPRHLCAGTPPQMRQPAGSCSRNACTVGSNTRSGKRARTGEYIGHTKRACCTSSSPPWQRGQVRCARGTRYHVPVSSASQCDLVRSWARAPGASAAALPPSTLPARAHTPPPLAAAHPKLQLRSVRAWRLPAAPLLPGSHGGGDAALSA